MQLSPGNVLRLLLAVTILASILTRPPGVMLVSQDQSLTYVICTGAGLTTIQVDADDQDHRLTQVSCDFFAGQIANLTTQPAHGSFLDFSRAGQRPAPQLTADKQRRPWRPQIARAPPIVS